MNALAKKPRKLRVERMQRLPDAGGDESHAWAVSYADFLMVLLSFFVVFFSQNEEQRGILIDIISSGQGKAVAASAAAAPAAGVASGSGAPGPVEQTYLSMKAIADRVPGFEILRDAEKQLIVLNFPENIYPPGEYELRGAPAAVLDDVLNQLQTQIGDLEIRFVGHTDDVQLQRRRGKTLATNFDLSSLRASRALERAVKLGLPPAQLSTRGQAEFSRNSRTLSIVVVQRVGGL